ncbi:helix-turn-helix transcriptional regulator [Culicoidibacter larvae]|uniref:YafY family transcriptional regulator n=1 Tax=Culicoidibacter larvae TaxID=2579976 RepID=A0A5R8QDL2_9FIRM|nr:YafY family protein [Culicoidibacter larvae]TLG75288.1 YafY family transcriptional regulator [Culicoidibacter larvae]
MKIDRLISIVMVLLEHEQISAPKLAEMFEVSPRTIYRDLETINQAGIPIVSIPGAHGGVSILDTYKVEKKIFTTNDMSTLLTGLGGLSSTLPKKEFANTLEKVKSMIPKEQMTDIELRSNQIAIDLTRWRGNKSILPNIEKIKLALNENRCLRFAYSNINGEPSIRTVEPYQLVLKEASWYLQAYCLEKNDFRIFKLSRFSNLEVLADTFIPRAFTPKPMDGSDWITRHMLTIKLRIHKSLREKIIDRVGEENIYPDKDASDYLLVDFPFVEDNFGYSLLLGFGTDCEVLEPAHIRLELQNRIQQMLDIYQ